MGLAAKVLRDNQCRLSLRERTFFRGAKDNYPIALTWTAPRTLRGWSGWSPAFSRSLNWSDIRMNRAVCVSAEVQA